MDYCRKGSSVAAQPPQKKNSAEQAEDGQAPDWGEGAGQQRTAKNAAAVLWTART